MFCLTGTMIFVYIIILNNKHKTQIIIQITFSLQNMYAHYYLISEFV